MGDGKKKKKRRPRNSCKAVIIENDRLLAIRKRDEEGPYYVLPGGGQHFGETFREALARECLEELGAEPLSIGRLLFIREYIGKNHEFSSVHAKVHQVEYIFECRMDSSMAGTGKKLDRGQECVEWLSLAELDGIPFYPKDIVAAIRNHASGIPAPDVYLGDIN